jgi:hypothetical protein
LTNAFTIVDPAQDLLVLALLGQTITKINKLSSPNLYYIFYLEHLNNNLFVITVVFP